MIKRSNWLDALAASTANAQLTPMVRQALARLDDQLFDIWNLGDNLVLVWTRQDLAFRFLAVRHYSIIEAFTGESASNDAFDTVDFINGILAGPKFASPEKFDKICGVLKSSSRELRCAFTPAEQPADALVTRLVARYGVSLVHERAVVLFDAVGFSLHSPLEQVAMLNSLSYSVDSAYRQLLSKDVDINYARTTTGDGFYIWNRARTLDANIALYKLMMLILTDNAVAQRKAKRFPVPRLRAAFHVGDHYEFYQVEALNPTTFGYIVGQVTIELSRIIERALPGQILLGDFNIDMRDEATQAFTRYRTTEFVEKTAAAFDQLNGLAVAGDHIETIRCYLTGNATAEGDFLVSQYHIRDKHGIAHAVYNAKINVHLRHANPIFLGLQNADLASNEARDTKWPGVEMTRR